MGIKNYLKAVKNKSTLIKTITRITEDIQNVKSLSYFSLLLNEHENVIAAHTGFSKAKDVHFSDFWGSVKSLGAWGGDFVLITSDKSPEETKNYFMKKGFDTIVEYKKMVL